MTIVVAAVSFSNAQETETPKKISLLEAFRGMISKIKQSKTYKAQPVKFVAVSENYDVRQHSVVTGARLNMFLKGVLRDKGDLFINVARDNDICPITLAAIAMHESANGGSKFSRERNNVFGIYLRGKYHYFDSVDECGGMLANFLAAKCIAAAEIILLKKSSKSTVQLVQAMILAASINIGSAVYWTR